MLLDALKILLVYAALVEILYYFRMDYCFEPIVIAPVIGLVMGDLTTGIIMGASLEAIFLGVMNIGAQKPTNPYVATAISTYYAIKTGANIEACIAIAYTVGLVANTIYPFAHTFFVSVAPFLKNILLKEGNGKKYNKMCDIFMWCGPSFIDQFAAVFIGILIGTTAINALLNHVPQWVLTGLSASGTALAAIGMGITLNLLWDKRIIGFYFVGFLLMKALGLTMIQIAVLGAAVAAVYLFIDIEIKKRKPAQVAAEGTEEGDFDL